MTKMKSLVLAGALVVMPIPVFAQIPVTDGAQIGQNLQQLAHQLGTLNELRQQALQLQAQIKQLENQTKALTGSYDLSKLANSAVFKELRRLGTFDDHLNIANGGGSGPVAEYGNTALEDYGLEEGKEIYQNQTTGTVNPLQVAHDKSRNAIAAGAGTARAIMAGSDRRTDIYEAFLDQIDLTENAKASSDLVARILTENGLLMNDLIRLQAMNLELQQVTLARELASDQADTNFFKPKATTP